MNARELKRMFKSYKFELLNHMYYTTFMSYYMPHFGFWTITVHDSTMAVLHIENKGHKEALLCTLWAGYSPPELGSHSDPDSS